MKKKDFMTTMYEWSEEGYQTLMKELGTNNIAVAAKVADMLISAYSIGIKDAYKKIEED